MSKTNQMVAHIWAQNNGEFAKSSTGNFHCSHNKLYSYRTMIARFYGNRVVRSYYGYSATTSSKHYPAMSSAITNVEEVYKYHGDVGDLPDTWEEAAPEILKELHDSLKDSLKSLKTKRSYLINLVEQVLSKQARIQWFCNTYQLPNPLSEVYTEEKLFEEFPTLRKRIDSEEEKRAKDHERVLEQMRLNSLSLDEKIAEWRKGKNVNLPYNYDNHVYLRIKNKFVETSKGIRISVEEAKALYPAIVNKTLLEGTILLEHFKFSRFTEDAFIAGCHTIPFEEINRVAKELGIV